VTKRRSKKGGTDKEMSAVEQQDERVETPSGEPGEPAAPQPGQGGQGLTPVSEAVEAEVGEPSTPAAKPAEGESIEALRDEIESLQAQSAEYLDGWQRARAEFANYKKRIDRDMEQSYAATAAQVLARYLPILDDIERALRERPDGEDLRAWIEGIELIHRKLTALLEAEGVERIPAETQRFDPNLHEAISFEENEDHEEGQIIDVIQQGYRLGERILRPAIVRVAR
jgi:molecular chaperone GrpE